MTSEFSQSGSQERSSVRRAMGLTTGNHSHQDADVCSMLHVLYENIRRIERAYPDLVFSLNTEHVWENSCFLTYYMDTDRAVFGPMIDAENIKGIEKETRIPFGAFAETSRMILARQHSLKWGSRELVRRVAAFMTSDKEYMVVPLFNQLRKDTEYKLNDESNVHVNLIVFSRTKRMAYHYDPMIFFPSEEAMEILAVQYSTMLDAMRTLGFDYTSPMELGYKRRGLQDIDERLDPAHKGYCQTYVMIWLEYLLSHPRTDPVNVTGAIVKKVKVRNLIHFRNAYLKKWKRGVWVAPTMFDILTSILR